MISQKSNKKIDWKYLSRYFYGYNGGNLPDIIFYDCTINDWAKFTDFINENHKVEFKSYGTQTVINQINLNEVIKFWKREIEEGYMASFYIDSFQFNTFFITENEIDFDFKCKEIGDIESHYKFINCIKEICNLLKKEASIYCEGSEEILLAKVNSLEIVFYDNL